jgi:hypothetical protein
MRMEKDGNVTSTANMRQGYGRLSKMWKSPMGNHEGLFWKEWCDLPMNQNTTSSLLPGPLTGKVCLRSCIASIGPFSPVIQSFLDEGIAPREMFNEIFVVHVIH